MVILKYPVKMWPWFLSTKGDLSQLSGNVVRSVREWSTSISDRLLSKFKRNRSSQIKKAVGFIKLHLLESNLDLRLVPLHIAGSFSTSIALLLKTTLQIFSGGFLLI